jgi:hypothetical protein
MANAKNEVAEVKNTLPAIASMFEEDANGGFEQADSTAYAIPFLSILQSGSPQVKKSDGAYIKGAEEGFLFNSVTQDIVDGNAGLTVIPCYYTRRFVRWGARDAGGGYKGEYLPTDPILGTGKDVDGRILLADDSGNFNPKTSDILVDTRNHYVLIVTDMGYTPALISISSTQIKKSRQWMSKMDGIKMRRGDGSLFTPPMFSHSYRLTTVPESNDKGSWYGWKIETVGPVEDTALYQAAKAFRDSVGAGEVKVQPPADIHQSGGLADDEVDF